MKALVKKEFSLLMCSPVAAFFVATFLLSCGLMLWLFPGYYNIPDGGYATLNKFFRLAIILFIVLIPALTMRSLSEEIRSKNLDVFRTRPKSLLSLYAAKFTALSLVVVIALVSTSVYVYSINDLAVPKGNIDTNEILASYICLLLFSFVFIAVGLFSSSLSKNQIVAFVIAIFFNFTVFYGFELLASLFNNPHLQFTITSLGLSSRFGLMQKGVFYISDILVIITYLFLFSVMTVYSLSLKDRASKRCFAAGLLSTFVLLIITIALPSCQFDFTADKRYTISEQTKEELNKLKEKDRNIHINIYLEGNLNPGFQRLRDAAGDMLDNFKRQSNNRITYNFINPHNQYYDSDKTYQEMNAKQMRGIALNEIDREGKASRKIIYPYAQIYSATDTVQVNLLKNITGYSAEENLNASIENLEFEFIDAIRLFTKTESESIAFIEGHGEIPRAYVYDAEELLSKYYDVNRGEIGNDLSVLDNFKVVIIAGPETQFSESEKFILDQYIMSGGRVLWLIDGVHFSMKDLSEKGASPGIKNNTNLDDLLFTYGIRINPDIIQDRQCASIYLTSGTEGNNSYIEQPWYYSPLLMPSFNQPVTKDISLVKGAFASSIDIIGKNDSVKKEVLLTSSENSHLVEMPEMITLDLSEASAEKNYFNQAFLPVAVSLQGVFDSAFKNRLIPDNIATKGKEIKYRSENDARMVIVSSSDLIRNEVVGHEEQTRVLPVGYDRVSGRQFGNRDFVINTVNWLAGNDDRLSLRSKQQEIRLLNKQKVFEDRSSYITINIIIPLLISLMLIGSFYIYRQRKYS